MSTSSELPTFLSGKQAAALLHVSTATLGRWARASRLPYVRTLGGHRRYPYSAILHLAEQLRLPAPASPSPFKSTLRVVAANGTCLQGYKLGDRFSCGVDGRMEPALCPTAAEALRPFVAALAEGFPGAPSQLACPVPEHMLLLSKDRG